MVMCHNTSMHVTALKTPIVHVGDDLFAILKQAFANNPPVEKSVVVVTSKIVSLCANRVVPNHDIRDEKEDLVRQEAELYTEPSTSKYNLMLTVKNQILAVNAGIDESNADGQYVLFPEDSYQEAARIWRWVRETYHLQVVGVLITDSRTFPLRWGQIGTCLAYCGLKPLNNFIGTNDLFGHELKMTQVNVAEALSVAAVLEMGEAAEAQPVALVTDAHMVQFQYAPPSAQELADLAISLDDDAYAPILKKAQWHKGGKHE